MLTLCDWMLAIAAHAYEAGYSPTMTDMTYDRLSRQARERGTELPGFLDYTGSWIGNMDREELDLVLNEALEHNLGKNDLHMPAVKQALDTFELGYSCCLSNTPCWRRSDGISN